MIVLMNSLLSKKYGNQSMKLKIHRYTNVQEQQKKKKHTI